eukprot:2094203-Rhodomonas_salina.1
MQYSQILCLQRRRRSGVPLPSQNVVLHSFRAENGRAQTSVCWRAIFFRALSAAFQSLRFSRGSAVEGDILPSAQGQPPRGRKPTVVP